MNTFDLLTRRQLQQERSRLLARITSRFEVIEEQIPIGPLRIEFTRVKDPNRVLDEICAEEDSRESATGQRREGNDLHLPYWAELWESSIGVGNFLVRAPGSEFRVQNVLDLGCGMGLAGTVAAAMGHRATLVDLETSALLFARLNTLPYARRVRVRRLNWQSDRLAERFDLILGADVLYEREQWEYLEPFWQAHLARDGAVVLGEPGRGTGDLFGEWIQQRGWTLTLFEQPVSSRPRPIRVFQLKR